jgi:hypothetical protein
VAGGEVVGAVEHHVRLLHQIGKILDALVERHDLDVGVDRFQRGLRGLDFDGADRLGAVEDLALQVGEVDLVGVGQGEAADAGGGEIEGSRTAEAARTNY